ncbi:hypothetical protein QW71_35940 [Paenibacillus sp. IHB B 3415]|nr:hypothetical protein QW71_35940 [Paenibacillus sp. IHB B 3415]
MQKATTTFMLELIPEIIDVQKSKLASQGAEEFFIQGFIEQGAKLTNIEQALSYYPKDRLAKSMNKLEAFFEELFTR